MASAIVGALRVVLSLDSAEFDSGMKRVASSAKTFSSDFTAIGRQATAIGSALTQTLTLPLVGLGIAAVKSATDFESSFAGIRKTVDGVVDASGRLTAAGLEIQQGLRDMAKEIPTNVNDLNRVAEAAGQLGIKKEDILSFTRTMADLGVTTNLTANEAATATAQIQNIFGAAGKDVDRFGATLVALGNAGASTEKDIVEMGVRIAKAGTQVGLTQAQVLAFASALSSIGIESEAGGSAISRVFLKINDAVAKGGSGLKEFARVAGMSSAEFKHAFQTDAATATVSFIEGLDRLKKSGENVNATLEGVVGKNIILKSTLMGAAGAGQLFRDQLELGNKAWQDNSALTKEAGERYKTFASQLTVLWNQVRDVAITFGTALLPTLKDLVGAVTPLVGLMAKMGEMFAALPEPVRLVAAGMTALVAATGPAIWAFGVITTNAGTLIKAFTAKGIATRALTAAYGPLSTAIVAAGTSFVGLGALAAAGAAALYQVGKAIVDLFNHWKAGGSMWEFFSARDEDNFVRRLLGWGKATRETDIALTGAAAAASEFVGPVNQVAVAASKTDQQLKAAKKSADAFTASLKSIGGADAMAGAQEAIKLIAALGGPLNILPAKLEELAGKLRDGAQAALLMGRAGLADQYTKLAATLSPMVQFQQRYNVTIGEYVTGAGTAAVVTEDLWEQFHRLADQVQTIGPMLKSSMILPFTQFKEAVKRVGPEAERSFDNISDAVKNLGNTILQAVQGGGSVLSSIGSSMGFSIGKDMQKNLSGFLTRNLGKTLGDAFGAVMPGVGALLGPALEKIGSGLKKIFGIGVNEEVRKANAEIEKMRQKLLDTHGPMDVLEAKANAVGLSFAENWGHQGKAGIEAFNALINEFNNRWAELEAKREKLEGELADTRGEFDSLIGKANELGYQFDQNGQFIGVSFDAVKAKANEFGVSVDGLGGKFRQLQIDQEAARIINGFTLMEKAGGDVGGILVGMKDEIGKLVGDSIKFGTTIPKNMEPWVKELMRTHQLTDENGVAITDLSQIKFGDPVATQFDKISTALLEVVNKLNDLLTRIAEIPTSKTFTVQAQYVDPGPPPGFGEVGGDGDNRTDDGFATGTLGRLGKWFGSFPKAGFATALHGIEAVVTPQQAPTFAMDVLAGLGGAGSVAAGGADSSGLLSEIQLLRRDLSTTIPAIAETAARHGAQTSGRRR
jgi:TP901 family phage tail tape measure protein